MAKTTKLHELLAVNTALDQQSNKVRGELQNTFEKKRHLFEEKRTTFQPIGENEPAVTESVTEIQTTVEKELDWISGHLAKAWDSDYQIAMANTKAKADVVLDDGTILLNDIPATSLLELEKRVAEVHALINAVPTLDPAKSFKPDSNRQDGVSIAREITKNRTKKVKKVLVKYEASKEHPAQTEVYDADEVIGKIVEQEWSGLLTPAQKADLLDRVEQVSRAVRAARSRANEIEVDTTAKIGARLLKYIFQNGK